MTVRRADLARVCRRAVATIAAAALAGLALTLIARGARPQESYRELARFGAVLDAVRERYVDKPDEARLIEAALEAMVASLDPHSGYMTAKAYRALESAVEGEVGNVGLSLLERGGLPVVESVLPGGSAADAGLVQGDAIEAIDGEAMRDVALDRAAARLEGAPNTRVRLGFTRPDGGRSEVEIRRDIYGVKAIQARIEDGDVGYIRIPQFVSGTGDAVKNGMERLELQNSNAKLCGYILDLRNNPGGLVDEAVEAVNALIDSGTILRTRGRTPGSDRTMTARLGENRSRGRPVVALVNGGTASAAEIVAGALQDLGRATLIGTRTFGKGSMQTTIRLGDGALHFTTGFYFTPSGRYIQARGVDPDIEIDQDAPAEVEPAVSGEHSLKGHLPNLLGERAGSQTYVPADPGRDAQLAAAVAFLHSFVGAPRR